MLDIATTFEMTRDNVKGLELYANLMHALQPQLKWISDTYAYAGDRPIEEVHKQCIRYLRLWLRRAHKEAGRPAWKFWKVRGKLVMVKVIDEYGRPIVLLDVERGFWSLDSQSPEGDDCWED